MPSGEQYLGGGSAGRCTGRGRTSALSITAIYFSVCMHYPVCLPPVALTLLSLSRLPLVPFLAWVFKGALI